MIFWKCIQYTTHWDKKQMLKTFPLDKINGTKNSLVLLSRAPTYHSFTFNLQFLYELMHKVCLSKTVCEIFHFRFRFVFKVYIFVQQNAWTVWLENVIIPFKIKIIEKPQTILFPAKRSFKIQWYLRELELPKNWPGKELFKLIKSKFGVLHFFLIVTFK